MMINYGNSIFKNIESFRPADQALNSISAKVADASKKCAVVAQLSLPQREQVHARRLSHVVTSHAFCIFQEIILKSSW